ncbi:MAG: DUF3833 domain-containing protein [Poseidonibacter sp.]|uniref:DUF3833 domain-containing protein n=2 Tax=Poseidonibacter sp. TaxID=2321188 RepID=UPI00359E5081
MKLKILFITLLLIIFTGCSKMQIDDFKNKKPEFIPQEYFNGPLRAYGMVKDRSGKIIKTFKGDLVGSWDENGVGTLDEKFVYDNGEKQRRVWTLKPIGDNKFEGTAGDIVGVAQMIAKGNTVMIDYTMRVPYNDSTIDINVKDWLHLQEDGVILNHSKMKKFGFTVGELVITIIKD